MRLLITMFLILIFWIAYGLIFSKYFKDQVSLFPSLIKIGVEYGIPIIIVLAMVFWRTRGRTRRI